jgi:hypothetical protein
MATLPSDLAALSEKDMGEWLGALGVPHLLPLLDEWGAETPEDLAHLESEELAQMFDGLKLVQKRKLQRALQVVRQLAGVEEPAAPAAAAAPPAAAAAAAAAPSPAPPPAVPRLSSEEVARQAASLQRYAGGSNVAEPEALRSLHASWAACVDDPSVRRKLLPSLFAIAKRDKAGAVGREAALALIFLAFSLSGTAIKVEPSTEPSTPGAAAPGECVVMILGWLGSGCEDFKDVARHYRQQYPRCKIVTTVGGNDRWARPAAEGQGPAAAADAPPLFAEGAGAEWPAAALCEEQLWRLASHMLPSPGTSGNGNGNGSGTPPRVLLHLFSNNGFMLYARLLRHLHERGEAGESACREVLATGISAVVYDSTPDPAYDPPLLKQVAVASVASVLKKEPVPGMSMRDLGMRTPLRAVVHAACEHAQDPVFDSTWHYEWLREHEPRHVPCLFVYSVTDRTIRQQAIELWMETNRDAWCVRPSTPA